MKTLLIVFALTTCLFVETLYAGQAQDNAANVLVKKDSAGSSQPYSFGFYQATRSSGQKLVDTKQTTKTTK